MQGHRKRALPGFYRQLGGDRQDRQAVKTPIGPTNKTKTKKLDVIPLCWVFFAIKIPTSE